MFGRALTGKAEVCPSRLSSPAGLQFYGGRLPAISAGRVSVTTESARREAPVSGPGPLSGKARPPDLRKTSTAVPDSPVPRRRDRLVRSRRGL